MTNKSMGNKTANQFDEQAAICREIFSKKAADYGTSWRVLRLSSLADQIFIKAQRIRTIDMLEVKKVAEEMDSEFIGIINYTIIGLIRLEVGEQIDVNEGKTLASEGIDANLFDIINYAVFALIRISEDK